VPSLLSCTRGLICRLDFDFLSYDEKRPKCVYCKTRFTTPVRGRPPSYCYRGHRYRAYEQHRLKRTEGRGTSIKLLRTDIATLLTQKDFRNKVIAVLREVGLLPSKSGPSKGGLRLVKPAEPSTERAQARGLCVGRCASLPSSITESLPTNQPHGAALAS
jgi:hypothetical protein